MDKAQGKDYYQHFRVQLYFWPKKTNLWQMRIYILKQKQAFQQLACLIIFKDFGDFESPFQFTQTDFNVTLGSPLGVIVNEYVVFHCQFEVGDLLTHPPRESRHIKSSWDRTADTVTYCLCECGSWLRGTKGDLPNGLDDFMSSIVMFILKTERDKILNTSQYKPLNSKALQTIASKTRPAGYRGKNDIAIYFMSISPLISSIWF